MSFERNGQPYRQPHKHAYVQPYGQSYAALLQTEQQQSLREKITSLAQRSPALFTLAVFAGIIITITLLLLIPTARTGPGSASFLEALFTATSAVSVTGLTIVDTATYWTPFGHTVIAIGMQIGGLGVMTIASLLGFAVSGHIGLTQKILTAQETKTPMGDLGSLLRAVFLTSFSVELLLTLAFLPSFLHYQRGLLHALGNSLFMAISSFNNGGFLLLPQGLTPYVSHWGMCIPIIAGTIIGALGFPVILNISASWRRPTKINLHTKLTVLTYAALLIIGALGILLLESSNAHTLGNLDWGSKILASLFHSATARSSGLATIDVASMNESSWWLLDGLMFIGGGSASTGGGIKVTTFAVLILAIVAETRGDRDAETFGRRLGSTTIRLAISVALLGTALVGSATLIILHISDFSLSQVLFETISAFGTCGLSTGITSRLPEIGQGALVALMYFGRVGTMTLAAALALRHRRRVIRMPQESPLIG